MNRTQRSSNPGQTGQQVSSNRAVPKKIHTIFELHLVFGHDSVLWCGISTAWFPEGWSSVGQQQRKRQSRLRGNYFAVLGRRCLRVRSEVRKWSVFLVDRFVFVWRGLRWRTGSAGSGLDRQIAKVRVSPPQGNACASESRLDKQEKICKDTKQSSDRQVREKAQVCGRIGRELSTNAIGRSTMES